MSCNRKCLIFLLFTKTCLFILAFDFITMNQWRGAFGGCGASGWATSPYFLIIYVESWRRKMKPAYPFWRRVTREWNLQRIYKLSLLGYNNWRKKKSMASWVRSPQPHPHLHPHQSFNKRLLIQPQSRTFRLSNSHRHLRRRIYCNYDDDATKKQSQPQAPQPTGIKLYSEIERLCFIMPLSFSFVMMADAIVCLPSG